MIEFCGQNWSEVFANLWDVECRNLFGHTIPMNFLSYDHETDLGEIGHLVPDGDDPLVTVDGETLRVFTVSYIYLGVTDYDRH